MSKKKAVRHVKYMLALTTYVPVSAAGIPARTPPPDSACSSPGQGGGTVSSRTASSPA